MLIANLYLLLFADVLFKDAYNSYILPTQNHIMSQHKRFLNERVLIKGAKTGHCRICKQFGALTNDHVPPKGSIKISPVALRTLAQDEKTKAVIAQGGTNFRTLCSNCNNNLLGKQYDPEINKVTREVGNRINQVSNLSYKGFHLPSYINVEVKPQRLARAVVGHLLASNYHPNQSDIKKHVPSSEALRYYFLNQDASMPKDLNIYYWFYPGSRQVLIREAHMAFYNHQKEPLIFGLMKFAPIAYMITWEEPKHLDLRVPKLFLNRSIGIDDTEQIRIDLDDYPRLDTPEHPHDDDKNIIFFNAQLTSVATRKIKKKTGFSKQIH